VPKAYVDRSATLARIEREQRLLAGLWDKTAAEPYWRGTFLPPADGARARVRAAPLFQWRAAQPAQASIFEHPRCAGARVEPRPRGARAWSSSPATRW
jgi:hypothetical protein